MTRLELEIDGQMVESELVISAPDSAEMAPASFKSVSLRIGQRSVAALVSEPEPGRFVVRLGQTILRADRDRQADGTEAVIVNGRRIGVAIRDRRRRRGPDAQASGTIQLITPMPGKVVAILVEEGATVERGAGIIVVEAMKMQNEIQAPRAGRLTSLRATPGQTVNAGEILATIE
ncbi:MAG: acetyl-CoA carboxylase biotin carboxyl carrier protein subunit [Acidobacteriota bacterium]